VSARPPFDPREELEARVRNLGEASLLTKNPAGGWVTTAGWQQGMSVIIDGVERITGGLRIEGDDPLVALSPCSDCDEWLCNLVDGCAARVRRLGPHVFWVLRGETHCFGLDRYREVFGGTVEGLPELAEEDLECFDEPASSGEYASPGGESIFFDDWAMRDGPLARLRAWPVGGSGPAEAVAPPARALEIRSLTAGLPSLWVDEAPRACGRRAAFLPRIVRVPVWLTGPDIDLAIAELLGARA
jgi:hypothetical protein